jgi:HAD superfamily hydrolase (TIGR01509 family)
VTARPPVRAVLFDFDGTLWDSESAVFEVFRELYRDFGHELPLESWASAIGTLGGFDPYRQLAELVAGTLDLAAVEGRTEARIGDATEAVPLRPGVEAFLAEIDDAGLLRGIVSSDTSEWIRTHLRRLGQADGWAAVSCADGVKERAKPRPDLYLDALRILDISSAEAVAFEDSPNGISAAKAAGIACICVPNALTGALDVSHADAQFPTFEGLHLDAVWRALRDRVAEPHRERSP